MKRGSTIAIAGLVSMLGACLGVETYEQRPPAASLAIRMVANERDEAELLPRLGDDGETISVARTEVVGASHILHVRLLDAADGTRVIVLDVDPTGRGRLDEASRANIGGRMAVVVGGRVVAAPTIRNPLTESEVFVAIPAPELDAAFDALTRGHSPGS